MKKGIFLFVSVFLIAVYAHAQDTTKTNHNHKHSVHHKHRAEHRAEHLAKKLNLSTEQKQKVHDLSLEKATEVESVKKQYANNPKEISKHVKLIRTKFKADMKMILSAEQYTKWEQLKKDGKKKVDNEAPDTDDLDD